jgi:Ca2+-binding EF-hand superfamily protein
MFKLFDTDNNLTMDEFELRIAMRGLGFGVSRQQAHRYGVFFS